MVNNYGNTLQAETISCTVFKDITIPTIGLLKSLRTRSSSINVILDNCWYNAPHEIFRGNLKDYIGEKINDSRKFTEIKKL